MGRTKKSTSTLPEKPDRTSSPFPERPDRTEWALRKLAERHLKLDNVAGIVDYILALEYKREELQDTCFWMRDQLVGAEEVLWKHDVPDYVSVPGLQISPPLGTRIEYALRRAEKRRIV